jgi:uncharacterized membrane protein YadS
VTKVERTPGQSVSAWEIWYRFPKFVIGFMVASIVFSIIDGSVHKDVSTVLIDQGVLRGFTREIREWCFALAFASIGLDTNFREFGQYFKGGKPVTLYVVGQSLQLGLTLLVAWLLFYVIFPSFLDKI